MAVSKTQAIDAANLLIEKSSEIQRINEDKEYLVSKLNDISTTGKQTLYNAYSNQTGIINALRGQVASILIERDITIQELEQIINTAREANPVSFRNMYKEWYNILYILLQIDYKGDVSKALNNLANYFTEQLDLHANTTYVCYDFAGPRQIGATRAWIAIYNKSHPQQSTALQLFLEFADGKLEYCIYEWPERVKIEAQTKPEIDDNLIDSIVTFFRNNKQRIINDVYAGSGKMTIKLQNGQKVFKVSMGPDHFSNEEFDTLIKERKIVVNRYTKALGVSNTSQGDIFLNEMQVGDYVYVCRGNTRMELIGQITTEVAPSANEGWADDGWDERNFDVIQLASDKSSYKGDQKWWAPNFNSTCYPVGQNEINFANNILFEPHFNLSFKTMSAGNLDNLINANNVQEVQMEMNTILYGPPGTGKTFRLQQLIESQNKVNQNAIEDIDEFISDYPLWQVVALALLDMGGAATVPEINKNRFVHALLTQRGVTKPANRLWSTLQHHTVEECPNVNTQSRHGEAIFYKEANSVWRLSDIESFKNQFEWLVDDLKEFNNSERTSNHKSYMFTTCHQSLSYEDFIEGIKPILNKENENTNEPGEVKYEIRKGYFYNACNEAAKLAGYTNLNECLEDDKAIRESKFKAAKENGSIFYLFLDEINRCNVSAVFGELITLIEDDKRLGAKNEISDILLPYSQKHFGVPANLYIIGTMNTADRSVEALDSALRRRFTFISMEPKPGEIKDIEGIDISLSTILTVINQRISYLLDNDHQIGHSYFMNIKNEAGLKAAFENKIIPLLKEYFYNDYEKIYWVLGDGFVEPAKSDKSIFNVPEAQVDMEGRYTLKEITANFPIVEALKTTIHVK